MKHSTLAIAALAALTTTAQAATTTVTCNFPRYGVVKLEMQIGPRVRNTETYRESHANSRFFMTVNGQRSGAMKTPESFVGGPDGDFVMDQINNSTWSFSRIGDPPSRARCQQR